MSSQKNDIESLVSELWGVVWIQMGKYLGKASITVINKFKANAIANVTDNLSKKINNEGN